MIHSPLFAIDPVLLPRDYFQWDRSSLFCFSSLIAISSFILGWGEGKRYSTNSNLAWSRAKRWQQWLWNLHWGIAAYWTAINFYRGYDHSTIEEEFRRLSDITDKRRCFMPQSKKQGALGVQPLLLGNDEMKIWSYDNKNRN